MSILSGVGGLRTLIEGPRPDYVPEPECDASASDDGAMGDSNSVHCHLSPGHRGPHWDEYVHVWWAAVGSPGRIPNGGSTNGS